MPVETINVLLVEDKPETAKLIEAYLHQYTDRTFKLEWRENGVSALKAVEQIPDLHMILMEHLLPGMTGLDLTRILQEKKVAIPVVFLTANKDLHLAVEAMKLGIEDYLLKDEISSPVFPRTLVGVYERLRLRREVSELETRRRRLEAMQELVVDISKEISGPLTAMRDILTELAARGQPDKSSKYLEIMKENVDRIEMKLEKLRNLRDDKTVQYIKDIKMVDIS